jgi:CRP-like cAMP-binding protein
VDPARLTAIPLFSELSDDEAGRLSASATESRAAVGQVLVRQGDYPTELIAIEEGTADVVRDDVVVASLLSGDVMGEMGLLKKRPCRAGVVATSPMRLIKLTHREIRRMSEETVERIKTLVRARSGTGPEA